MRGMDGDNTTANKLLSNSLTMQDLDTDFEQNYGSFKKALNVPFSSGKNALWKGEIYDSYDPNNAYVQDQIGRPSLTTKSFCDHGWYRGRIAFW